MSAFPREADRPVVSAGSARCTADAAQPSSSAGGTCSRCRANFPIANDGAKVLIVEFADFQCPHCKQMYFAYKPILDKYLRRSTRTT